MHCGGETFWDLVAGTVMKGKNPQERTGGTRGGAWLREACFLWRGNPDPRVLNKGNKMALAGRRQAFISGLRSPGL